MVQNPKTPQNLVEIHLLLDSGSQKSYLTERAKQLLGLESSREQILSIATFGSQKEQTKVCPVVDVRMCLKGYPPMSLSLYVVPTICEPLVSQPITACVQQSKAFSGLDLDDHSDGEGRLQVDMLIGSDYYWDIVTGRICKIDGGPTAVHTKLGWVLSGPTSARGSVSCSVNLTTTHVFNRLYAIDASRSTRVAPSNRDRRLKAHAPLLLCYSRAYHSIVDQFGLGILPVVSTGNTLLLSGFGSLVDL